jgi:LemA protein
MKATKRNSMKRRNLLILAIAIFLGITQSSCNYNAFVTAEEEVNKAWSQVENVYQRRADLVPQLVSTVKGAAEFEKTTFEAVTEARAQASSIKLDPSQMTEADLKQFQQAQDNLSKSLGKLMVTVEKYPDLKATANFKDLQAQLEGTENRIAVERKKFNEAAQSYNTMIRRFPKNLLAKIYGFEKRPYFQASPEASQAPVIEF